MPTVGTLGKYLSDECPEQLIDAGHEIHAVDERVLSNYNDKTYKAFEMEQMKATHVTYIMPLRKHGP